MMDAAPPIWLPPKPAIIHRLPIVRVRYGTDVVTGKMEYAEHAWPRDIFDASLPEALVYLPGEFDPKLPEWALAKLIPSAKALLFVPIVGWSGFQKTVEFLTSTSASDQTYNVAEDFNVADNYVGVVSAGSHGSSGQGANTGSGGGGGGGGFAAKSNISLTPGGAAPYRLRAANTGSGTGSACWFNGTSLAASSVGVQCAANTASVPNGKAGAVTTSAVGDVTNAGGDGGNGTTGSGDRGGGGGGGAAGPDGVGANGQNASGATPGNGGSANGGTPSGNGVNGTKWNDGSSSKGPGTGGKGKPTGSTDGGQYGGGGGGGNSTSTNSFTFSDGEQGLIVVINNASL